MCGKSIVLPLLVILCAVCNGLNIFHKGSKVTFYPETSADYFGFSLLLSSSSLTVGAPKAASTVQGTVIKPGRVFSCSLKNLAEYERANTTCQGLNFDKESSRMLSRISDYTKDDMWFGASIALTHHGDLLICAPRWTSPYRDTHMLANGICYVQSKSRGQVIRPLSERNRQAFLTDGTRKEYGEYGTHLNFYAYGQAGMSVKVTSNNSLIIGAPGLLQWTGGVIDFRFASAPSRQPITNPYYTKELGPDDYFGYAVESGIFETSGKILYVSAAPRSMMGYGQVLIFEPATREVEALFVRVSVKGPQLGSYFGAALACADVNGDGRVDLLVGAPNYVAGGELPFDQGAVFVYLNRETNLKGMDKDFMLEEAGHVSGSSKNGARFGTSIADLGDIDGDGFRDIAIGAPWEDNGAGAVYIYRGSSRGLQSGYLQRITEVGGRGFGMALSPGLDLDDNMCNELAVGAHASGTAYIYRCVPTLTVKASIEVPDAMDLPQNATNFTVLFCVKVEDTKLWPYVSLNLKASIAVDTEDQRAVLSGEDEYTVIAKPGMVNCEEQVVEVKPTADLSKPISLKFVLEIKENMTDESFTFIRSSARLSDDSEMESRFQIQLTRDCGDDLICRPLLNMTLSPLDSSTYVPGTGSKLGVQVIITNIGEPAYGAKVYIALPFPPKRVPTPCTLKEYNLNCSVPAPLPRDAKVIWDVELEYSQNSTEESEFKISARLEDPFQKDIEEKLEVFVRPMASFNVSGKALPNATLPVTRQTFSERGFVIVTHYYEILNNGPSDWPVLETQYELPEMLSLTHAINGCVQNLSKLICVYSAPANLTLPILLNLRYDLIKDGDKLEESMILNLTTSLTLLRQNITAEVKTTLVLEPAQPVWPLIFVGLTLGFLVLAAIIYGLYKYGFFSRDDREKLKQLKSSPSEDPCGSTSTIPLIVNTDESSEDPGLEDSD